MISFIKSLFTETPKELYSKERDLIFRLRKRASIRRNNQTRKSVQEGMPDRISDLLEEAADTIEKFL
jgi:hypothetical protein